MTNDFDARDIGIAFIGVFAVGVLIGIILVEQGAVQIRRDYKCNKCGNIINSLAYDKVTTEIFEKKEVKK